MFLDPKDVAATNRHVHGSPAERLPAFKATHVAAVESRYAILRYSTTSPAAR